MKEILIHNNCPFLNSCEGNCVHKDVTQGIGRIKHHRTNKRIFKICAYYKKENCPCYNKYVAFVKNPLRDFMERI